MEILIKANMFNNSYNDCDDYCSCDCDDCGCDYDYECSGDGMGCSQD